MDVQVYLTTSIVWHKQQWGGMHILICIYSCVEKIQQKNLNKLLIFHTHCTIVDYTFNLVYFYFSLTKKLIRYCPPMNNEACNQSGSPLQQMQLGIYCHATIMWLQTVNGHASMSTWKGVWLNFSAVLRGCNNNSSNHNCQWFQKFGQYRKKL